MGGWVWNSEICAYVIHEWSLGYNDVHRLNLCKKFYIIYANWRDLGLLGCFMQNLCTQIICMRSPASHTEGQKSAKVLHFSRLKCPFRPESRNLQKPPFFTFGAQKPHKNRFLASNRVPGKSWWRLCMHCYFTSTNLPELLCRCFMLRPGQLEDMGVSRGGGANAPPGIWKWWRHMLFPRKIP